MNAAWPTLGLVCWLSPFSLHWLTLGACTIKYNCVFNLWMKIATQAVSLSNQTPPSLNPTNRSYKQWLGSPKYLHSCEVLQCVLTYFLVLLWIRIFFMVYILYRFLIFFLKPRNTQPRSVPPIRKEFLINTPIIFFPLDKWDARTVLGVLLIDYNLTV